MYLHTDRSAECPQGDGQEIYRFIGKGDYVVILWLDSNVVSVRKYLYEVLDYLVIDSIRYVLEQYLFIPHLPRKQVPL